MKQCNAPEQGKQEQHANVAITSSVKLGETITILRPIGVVRIDG